MILSTRELDKMYQKTTLDNGIRIVTEEIPYVKSVSIGFWIVVGSRNERRDENGISHFIEHMLFKGTKKRTAIQIAKEIDSVGGFLNACTNKEYTSFYAKVLSKDFSLAIDLLSDIFLHSIFNPEEIEKEKQVILQEICMVEDTPDEHIQELFNKSFFCNNPLSYSVIGNKENVFAVNQTEMVDFFNEYYTSDRIIISVAGNLEHNEVVRRIEETLGSLPKKNGEIANDLTDLTRHVSVYQKDLEQVHLCFGTKGLSQTHPMRYAGYVLNAVLGGGMSSRLFQEIRERRGLVYSVYSYMSSYSDIGLFTIYAGTDKETFNMVIELVTNELKKFKAHSLTEVELQMAKEQLKGNLILACESIDNRMSKLAKGEIYFGRSVTIDEIIENIEKVTPEEVSQLAEDIFNKDYFSLALLGNVQEEGLADDLLHLI